MSPSQEAALTWLGTAAAPKKPSNSACGGGGGEGRVFFASLGFWEPPLEGDGRRSTRRQREGKGGFLLLSFPHAAFNLSAGEISIARRLRKGGGGSGAVTVLRRGDGGDGPTVKLSLLRSFTRRLGPREKGPKCREQIGHLGVVYATPICMAISEYFVLLGKQVGNLILASFTREI